MLKANWKGSAEETELRSRVQKAEMACMVDDFIALFGSADVADVKARTRVSESNEGEGPKSIEGSMHVEGEGDKEGGDVMRDRRV